MRRWAVGICVAIVASLLSASPVFAHATFVTSDPITGSVVDHAPRTATLRFDEAVLPTASNAELLYLGEDRVASLPVRRGDDDRTLLVDLPDLATGPYILRYVVVDPADLHRTVGSISFGVGVAAPPSSTDEQISASTASTVVRFLASLALIGGGGAVILLVVHGSVTATDPRRRRLERAVHVAAWTVAGTWFVALVIDAIDVGWGTVRWTELLASSDPGRRVLIGTQLAVGVWWSTRLHRRANSTAGHAATAKLLTILWVAMLTLAGLGGHAAVGGHELIGVVLHTAHLASLCAWLGVVAVTWLVHRRLDSPPNARQWWRTASRAAAYGLAATGASGLLLSSRTVATVTAAFTTEYGRLLIGKLLLLCALAVLGAAGARRVTRHNAPGSRTIRVELATAAVAVALAAMVSGLAPARGERFTPTPTPEAQVATADVGDLTVSASIQPARPGPNLLQLRVLDTRRPAPGAIAGVEVTVWDASGNEVAVLTGVPVNGLIEWSSLVLPSPGQYKVTAAIDRPAVPVPAFDGAWTATATPVPRARTIVSDRSLGPMVALAAAAWLIVVGLGARLVRRRPSLTVVRTDPEDPDDPDDPAGLDREDASPVLSGRR